MLKFLNDFNYWADESFLLPTEIEDFKGESIQRWKNGFKARYIDQAAILKYQLATL